MFIIEDPQVLSEADQRSIELASRIIQTDASEPVLAELEALAKISHVAMHNLGVVFTGSELGASRPELANYPRAVECFEASPLKMSKNNLAMMLYYGKGVAKDSPRAKAIFAALARKRDGKAMFNLALMYRDGDPMPASRERYYKWLCRAWMHGSVKAKDYLAKDFNKHAWEKRVTRH